MAAVAGDTAEVSPEDGYLSIACGRLAVRLAVVALSLEPQGASKQRLGVESSRQQAGALPAKAALLLPPPDSACACPPHPQGFQLGMTRALGHRLLAAYGVDATPTGERCGLGLLLG